MKVQKLESRIIKYRLRDDEGGVFYYTLDLDKYELLISGETNASYKWEETPQSESFLKLMVRCDKWYLLEKLFEEEFDFSASVKAVKEYIKEYYDYETDDTLQSINEDIDEMDCNDIDYFLKSIETSLDNHYLLPEWYDLCECIENHYKYWDEKAIDHFCKYIKPELRKELEREDTE